MQTRHLVVIRGLFLVLSLLAVLLVSLVGTGTVEAHRGVTAAQDNSCYRTRVGLEGTKVVSRVCLLKDKPAAGSVSPYTVQPGSCDPSDVQLFEDAYYGSGEICFWLSGTIGSVNLTDEPLNFFANWNDRVSSYKTGMWTMTFSWDINGYGQRYGAQDEVLCNWIGSHWNDQASWLQLTRGSGHSQTAC